VTVLESVLVAAHRGAGLAAGAARELTVAVLDETGLRPDANRPALRLGLLQRKRLELARALATLPRLLMLDEVAAGLTDPEVRQLVGVIQAVRERGAAVILVEHVVRPLVGVVDRLICLAGGRFTSHGTPEEVLARPAEREGV